MAEVPQKYILDENGEIFSPIVSAKSVQGLESVLLSQTHSYTVKLTSTIISNSITIPAQYTVGNGSLIVYFNGEKLIKASAQDTEGHYYEVGETNSKSNTITLADDWYNSAENKPITGDVFEFIIKGLGGN